MSPEKKISFFSVIDFVNLILADNFVLPSFFLRIAKQALGVNPNPCHSFIRGTKPSENEAARYKIIKFKHITGTDMPRESKCYYSKLPFIFPSQMLIEALWDDQQTIYMQNPTHPTAWFGHIQAFGLGPLVSADALHHLYLGKVGAQSVPVPLFGMEKERSLWIYGSRFHDFS